LVIKYFKSENQQYLYDSHLHPDYFYSELVHEYQNDQWLKPFMSHLNTVLTNNNVKKLNSLHIGASTGRISFELTKTFECVVAIDFCSLFLKTCLELQSKGTFHLKYPTKSMDAGQIEKSILDINLDDDVNKDRVIFHQLTWLSNEIPKSDFILFTMIDRVTYPRCKLNF
jgi:hypothetical protein